MRLPVIPAAIADECPAGFILRIAYRNGWASPNALMSGLGGRVSGSGVSRALLLEYVDLLSIFKVEVPVEMVDACITRRIYPKRFRLADGVDLAPASFREACSAICPECLFHSQYVRQIWSLKCYNTCHIHGRQLLHTCAECSRPLTYHRAAPHRCSCGANLSLAKARSGDVASAQKLHRLVEDRQVDEIDIVSGVFAAICATFEEEVESGKAHELEFFTAALAPREALAAWLAERLRMSLAPEHPRLKLVPFLISRGILRDVAVQTLELLDGGQLTRSSGLMIAGYMTRREACRALGIWSHRVIAQLGQQGLLSEKSFSEKARGAIISRDQVNRLLFDLYRHDRDNSVPVRAQTTPLSRLIRAAQRSPEKVDGYSLAAGLTSFRLKPSVVLPAEAIQAGRLSLAEVSKILQVHKDVVRCAARLGHITALPGRRGTSPLVFDSDEVTKFEREFVFASSLARSIGAEAMKFSNKLFAAGVKPVAGPTINGLYIYLFARKDLAGLNLRVIAGGKSRAFTDVTSFADLTKSLEAAYPSLSILEIADDLSLPHTEVSKILRAGALTRVTVPGREVRVCKKSYASFAEQFRDPDLIEISAAAALAGEPIEQFRTTWIDTKLLEVVDFGIRRCVSRHRFIQVQRFRQQYITAREAAELAQKGRHLLPNLEARGAISSIHRGQGRTVRFFNVDEVQSHFWKGPVC